MAYPVAAATTQHKASASSITVTLPTHATGDLIVIGLAQDVGGTAFSLSGGSGWTVRNPGSVSGATRGGFAYKYVTSAPEANPTFSGAATGGWSAITTVIRDADPTTPINTSSGTGYVLTDFTTNPTNSGSLTTGSGDAGDGALLLYGWAFDGTDTYALANENELVELGKDKGDATLTQTVSQIVGYRNQNTAGAAPTVAAYGSASTEGGNGWVIAVKNKSGGSRAPDCRNGITTLKWYGVIGGAHFPVTWTKASDFTATINSIPTDTAAPGTGNGTVMGSWGTATYVETNTSVAAPGNWSCGTHTISSTNMSGKIFTLHWNTNSYPLHPAQGAEGILVGFSDGTNWTTYQLSTAVALPAAGGQIFSQIALGSATPYCSEAGVGVNGSINWAAVTRIAYLLHRSNSSASYLQIDVKNAALIGTAVLTGGGSTAPVTPKLLYQAMNCWGRVGICDLQGVGQVLAKFPVQFGDGTIKTYVDTSATSMEYPKAYSTVTQNTWNVNASAVSVTVLASSTDTMNLTAGILATGTLQPFTISASSSTSATYSFNGESIVSFAPTLKAGITYNGATFTQCPAVATKGGDLTNCTIKNTTATSTQAAVTVDTTGSTFSGCTTDVTGTAAGYHIELGTAVTAITLTNHTFTGTAATDKVHVLKTLTTVTAGSFVVGVHYRIKTVGSTDYTLIGASANTIGVNFTATGVGSGTGTADQAVKITISGTTSLAEADVTTAGAPAWVAAPALIQSVVVSGITVGARVQIYDTTSSTELFNGTATAGDTVVSGSTVTWTDPLAASASRAIRIRVSYVSGATAKNFIETSGLTCGVTSGTESITYPVSPTDDSVYNANAITGSGVTGVTFTDAATDVMNIDVAANTISWPTIYAAWVYYAFGATGIASDIDYIDAVDTANYILSNLIIKNTSSPAAPLVVTGGYGRDAITLATVDLVDTTGGTLIFAPDHVVSYAVGSGVTSQDKVDIAAEVLTAAAAAPIASNIKQVNDLTVSGAGTEANPWGP